MKTIKKDEIYNSLNSFLKSKGISMSSGSYSKAVKKACGFLSDAVILAQEGVHKTRVKVDSNLDKLRQTIHEATAPKPPILKTKKAPVRKKAARKAAARKAAPKKTAKKKTTRPAAKRKSATRKA